MTPNGPRQPPPLPKGRKPATTYTAHELRTMLIDDGCARYFGADKADEWAYLAWMIEAVGVIAVRERLTPEYVFLRLDGEVFERCGMHLRVA